MPPVTEKAVQFRHITYPNFHPLIWDMLWKPPHLLRGWHVFHAGDGQFWPLPRRVGHCLDTRRVPVWRAPPSVFVSDAATLDDWSHKSEFNSRQHLLGHFSRDFKSVEMQTFGGGRSEPELNHLWSLLWHLTDVIAVICDTSSCSNFTVKSKQLLPALPCFVNFIVLQ